MNPLVVLLGLAFVPPAPSGVETTAAVTRHLQVERTAPKIISDRPMVLDRRSGRSEAPQGR